MEADLPEHGLRQRVESCGSEVRWFETRCVERSLAPRASSSTDKVVERLLRLGREGEEPLDGLAAASRRILTHGGEEVREEKIKPWRLPLV